LKSVGTCALSCDKIVRERERSWARTRRKMMVGRTLMRTLGRTKGRSSSKVAEEVRPKLEPLLAE
jgi:hypothetical protein